MSGKIAVVLHEGRARLVGATGYYRRTDDANAARFDATVTGRRAFAPSVLVQQLAENPCAPWFIDTREPVGRLVPVAEVEYTHPLAVLDNISLRFS